MAQARGEYERAAAMQEENLALTRRRGDQWNVAYPLTSLAYLASMQGDLGRATALLVESLDLRRELGDERNVALCLQGLAWVAGIQGSADRAARLFGAEDALRERIGAAPMSHWVAVRERAVSAARAELGEEAFAAAWAEGRALPLDQAIAYALARTGCARAVEGNPPDPSIGRELASLTRREREVAALIARGLTNRQIADALVITEWTADSHVRHILTKLGVASRAQVAAWASEQGLIGPDPS